MTEPMPPDISTLADRLFSRLPGVYRRMDIGQDWLLKRYVGAVTASAGEIDDLIERVRGSRPVGPAAPIPWGLTGTDLARWTADREARPSALSDPYLADAEWLPWLAALVGAPLDPSASEEEKRDTIRYATSGWRAGTRGAMIDAAKSALTGTRYAQVYPHTKSDESLGLIAGTVWDVTVVTRSSETPDVNAVLGAILRKGVKPAGVVLWHKAYEATWDTWAAVYPTWDLFDAATWTERQEAGLVYMAQPGQLLPNPSFEVDTTGWSGQGGSSVLTRQAGGVDGAGFGRITASGSTTGDLRSPVFSTAPGGRTVSFSFRSGAGTATAQIVVQYRTAGNANISTQTVAIPTAVAGLWQRVDIPITAPATTANAYVDVQVPTMTAAQTFDTDAWFVR
jgi:hypothetical protein